MNKSTKVKLIVVLLLAMLVYSIVGYMGTYEEDNSFYIIVKGTLSMNNDSQERFEKGEGDYYHPPLVRIAHNLHWLRDTSSPNYVHSTPEIKYPVSHSKGEYSQKLLIPQPMELRVEIDRGESKAVQVTSDKKVYEVNLTWTAYYSTFLDKYNETNIREPLDTREKNAREEYFKHRENLSKEQQKDIEEDFSEADRRIESARDNEKALQRYLYAYWYFTRALFKIEYYRLLNCANESELLLETHRPTIYNIPYERKFVIDTTHSYFNSTDINSSLFQEDNYITRDDDVTFIKRRIETMDNTYYGTQGGGVQKYRKICEAALNELRENFKYQEEQTKKRLRFIATIAAIFLFLGFAWGRRKPIQTFISERHQEMSEVIEKWHDNLNLKESKNFISTLIVGLIAGDIAFLKIPSLNPSSTAATRISLIFVVFSLLFGVLYFGTDKKYKSNMMQIIILGSLLLGLFTFPIFFSWIQAILQLAYVIISTIIGTIYNIVMGNWGI